MTTPQPAAAQTSVWNGVEPAGPDWFNKGNWTPSGVPTHNVEITTPAGVPTPVISGDAADITGFVHVGAAGVDGHLIIQNGGTLTQHTQSLSVGGANASVTVTDPGSALIGRTGSQGIGTLTVGNANGAGTLEVLNGASVTGYRIDLALDAGTAGDATFSGTGTTVTVPAGTNPWLSVGFSGTGSLEITDGATASSVIGAMATNGSGNAFVVIEGAGSIWSITGGGEFHVAGAGTATLDLLDGGTLDAGASQVNIGRDASGNGAVLIGGAGSLLTTTNDLTIGSAGTGEVTVQNGGTLDVGGTLHIARQAGSVGTLAIGDVGGEPPAAPGAVNASAIQFGAGLGKIHFNHTSANYVFAPSIHGPGTVDVIAGTTIFTGDSDYDGGTLIASGATLQLGNGGTTGSITGDVIDEGTLTFNRSNTYTFDGVISGTGGVEQAGSGTTILTGDNTYDGPTNVNAGTLVVNGSTASDTAVAAGATLGGTGTIGGNVTNHGRVAPGSPPSGSIGTLHIGGNFTSEPGSTLQIEVTGGGTTPGVDLDLIAVDGDVSLNGNGTVHVLPLSGGLMANTRYTFLTYTGARIGEFAGIADDGLPLADLQLLYDQAGMVQFEFERNATDYCDLPGLTYNEHQIACYLDQHEPTATGDLANLFNTLAGMGTTELERALDQLTGQAYATMPQLAVQNTTQVYLLLQRRFRGRRIVGYDRSYTASAEPEIITASYDPASEQLVPVYCPRCSTWDGWITGYGLGGNAQSDGNASGGDYGIGGTVFALERWLDPCHAWGFFGAYSAFDLELEQPVQAITANDFQGGSYLRGGDGFNYYVLAGSMGWDDYSATRRIDVGNIHQTASGRTDGWQAAAWLERGVEFCWSGYQLQPFGALQYIYVREDGFAETGAGVMNLDVGGIDTHALRGILGGYASRPMGLRNGQVLTPQARALWLHEFLETETSLNSVFGGVGGASFATRGLDFGRDWAVLGGGFDWQLNHCLTLFADYDLQFNAVQTLHLGSGGLQYVW